MLKAPGRRRRKRLVALLPWISAAVFSTGAILFLLVFVLGVPLTLHGPPQEDKHGLEVSKLQTLPTRYVELNQSDFDRFPVILQAVQEYRAFGQDFHQMNDTDFELVDHYLDTRCFTATSGPCIPVVLADGGYYAILSI